MINTLDRVSFDMGFNLKQMGFGWPCHYYDGDRCYCGVGLGYLKFETYTPTPELDLALKWFRVTKGIHVVFIPDGSGHWWYSIIKYNNGDGITKPILQESEKHLIFRKMEEAQSHSIEHLITLYK